MLSKKDCVIGASVIYLLLIIIFVNYQHKPAFEYVCTHDSPCIRFCCRNQSTCNDTFIRQSFNVSEYSINPSYKIMMGEPRCSKTSAESNQTWSFLSVLKVKKNWDENNLINVSAWRHSLRRNMVCTWWILPGRLKVKGQRRRYVQPERL